MARSDRLFTLLQILRDGARHTAQDLAAATGVTARTIWRDMGTLAASGVPVVGTRGAGYRLADVTTLPPLSLTQTELEVLNLGVAIATELADEGLKAAAQSLAAKLDAALPQSAVPQAEAWKFAASPFADATRGFAQMPLLRAAIAARQKLRVTYTDSAGRVTRRVLWPLHLDYTARVWTLTAWCESAQANRVFRLDLISGAEALPALFTDAPGRTQTGFIPPA